MLCLNCNTEVSNVERVMGGCPEADMLRGAGHYCPGVQPPLVCGVDGCGNEVSSRDWAQLTVDGVMTTVCPECAHDLFELTIRGAHE